MENRFKLAFLTALAVDIGILCIAGTSVIIKQLSIAYPGLLVRVAFLGVVYFYIYKKSKIAVFTLIFLASVNLCIGYGFMVANHNYTLESLGTVLLFTIQVWPIISLTKIILKQDMICSEKVFTQ